MANLSNKEGAYTPGPWSLDGFPTAIWANGVWIASTNMDNVPIDERRANARLIAAAPELLVALKAFPMLFVPASSAWGRQVQEWQDIALAAIAKAEGRS